MSEGLLSTTWTEGRAESPPSEALGRTSTDPAAGDDGSVNGDPVNSTHAASLEGGGRTPAGSVNGDAESMGSPRPSRSRMASIATPPVDLFRDPKHLTAQWPQLRPWVNPFESDRREYLSTSKYPPGGCTHIEFHPALASRFLEQCDGNLSRVATLLSTALGFDLVKTVMVTTTQSAHLAAVRDTPMDPDASTSVVAGLGGSDLDDASSGKVSPVGALLSASTQCDDAVAFIVRPNSDYASSSLGAASAVAHVRRGSRLSLLHPSVHNATVASPPSGVSFAPRSGLASPHQSMPPSHHGSMSGMAPVAQPRVLFEDEGSPIDRIRELEAEVRELSRQLRSFQAEQHSRNSANNSPTNQVVISSLRPSTVAVGTATTVRVTVSALDPDYAPYSIKIGRSIVPCVVTDRRILSFVTPPLPPGSIPVQVMSTTAQGSVRRYGRAVWLESKAMRGSSLLSGGSATIGVGPGLTIAFSGGGGGGGGAGGGTTTSTGPRLTRHAVNQIGPDVPMVCTSTMRDPSEAGRSAIESTTAKSEYDETSDTESQQNSEVRVPLTREMLAMISGRMVRSAGSDTNSEAVASTIQTATLRVNSVAPQDTVSAPSTDVGNADDIAEAVVDPTAEDLDEAASTRGGARGSEQAIDEDQASVS